MLDSAFAHLPQHQASLDPRLHLLCQVLDVGLKAVRKILTLAVRRLEYPRVFLLYL